MFGKFSIDDFSFSVKCTQLHFPKLQLKMQMSITYVLSFLTHKKKGVCEERKHVLVNKNQHFKRAKHCIKRNSKTHNRMRCTE